MNILTSDVKLNYWAGMLNTSYLSGWITKFDGDVFRLQQNNNPEHALAIKIDDADRIKSEIRKLEGHPITIGVRVSGTRDEHGAQCELIADKIYAANRSDLPPPRIQKQGGGTLDSFLFADEDEEDESEVPADALSTQIMRSVLEATGNHIDTRFSSNSNCAALAGFIKSVQYVRPTEYRHGYALALVQQEVNENRAIPVRIRTAHGITTAMKLVQGMPVLVFGRLRRKVIPDDFGRIVSTHSYVETPTLYRARPEVDIQTVPTWLINMLKKRIAA